MRQKTLVLALLAALSCGDDDGERTSSACETADDCFTDIDREALVGEAQCLDRVEGGYCTHLCESDDDCCAVDGECVTDVRQVCAPFESEDDKRCFLSCEEEDLGELDETEFCAEFAHRNFICRSTGGGVENRKVCVPEG